MKYSTQDRIAGTAKQVKGRIKEGAGKLVGNPRLKAEGRAERIEGRIQKKIGEIEKACDC